MFNPFFTSKAIGKGTGLGLSISNNIISKCGGLLELDNDCANTCFIVKLIKANNTINDKE
jgi:two-component system sensor histidine kinase HupT/HoxJ